MVEVIIKKMYIDAEYNKGVQMANKVRGAKINLKTNLSEGDFASSLNNSIDKLNSLFLTIAAAMDEANAAIKNAGEEFTAMDDIIASALEVVNKPKL